MKERRGVTTRETPDMQGAIVPDIGEPITGDNMAAQLTATG